MKQFEACCISDKEKGRLDTEERLFSARVYIYFPFIFLPNASQITKLSKFKTYILLVCIRTYKAAHESGPDLRNQDIQGLGCQYH